MKDADFAKLVVFVNSSVPLAMLGWDAYWHRLGPDAPNRMIHTTGMLALIFLMLSLAVTPLRKMSGWNFLSHFRRMLGLFAFFYACLHLLAYVGFDKEFDLRATAADVWKRPFIFYGMACLVLLAPLAATSTNAMIKRLGAARWKRLHRLVYVAGVAAVIHFYLQVKADHTQPIAFAVALALLLGYRVVASRVPALRRRPRIGAAA